MLDISKNKRIKVLTFHIFRGLFDQAAGLQIRFELQVAGKNVVNQKFGQTVETFFQDALTIGVMTNHPHRFDLQQQFLMIKNMFFDVSITDLGQIFLFAEEMRRTHFDQVIQQGRTKGVSRFSTAVWTSRMT